MKKIQNLLLIISVTLLYFSCNKQYDDPPVNQVPIGDIILISDLKDMFTGSVTLIDSNYSIFGNITSEETNGNFYKEVFMQDLSGAIKLKLKSSGGLYIGDSIRINVQNVSMSEYGDLIQLENIDVDQQVVKIATEKFIEPYEATINQLSLSEDQSRLVKLNDVEFTELGMTYADAINLSTGSRILSDCNGNTVSVRTSGYANFASDTLPAGKGSITGIFTIYNSEKQFVIRDINEVKLDSSRCNGSSGGGGGSGGDYLYKDFDDGSLTSGGWNTFWSGTNPNLGEWEILFGNIAKASNYSNFNNYACESWLVSPNIDLSNASAPYLIFDNDTRYNGPQLELYISSNYDGVSNPDVQGTWFELTNFVPNWDPDSNDWGFVSSGNIDLTQFISSSVTIAYKYIGTDSDGATWEVDNIIIRE
ncbi:MAG: DUF5689 domain-containing protein [Flavobacteriales bacterium]|nr:DUF5689 domain-containing protein [Flavobacteriales bacterium]